MIFKPDASELFARARSDFRMAVPIIVRNGDAGAIAMSAETVQEDRLSALINLDRPTVLVLTERRSSTLKARAYDGDIARVVVPPDADAAWIRTVADPASDLHSPLKGPFATEREGDPNLHRTAVELARRARLLPAALVNEIPDPVRFGARNNLTVVEVGAAGDQMESKAGPTMVASARLPIRVHSETRIFVFRLDAGSEEHCAIEIGRPERSAPVLVRLHSACFTGDVLDSLKCDCGTQLAAALDHMSKAGGGILLYLNQEGRGIGLGNKVRAYSLQDQGFDTLEANHRLGFEGDERDFGIAADILKHLGFASAQLMTNNPNKVRKMEAAGIGISERIPLQTKPTEFNEAYLAAKSEKFGHLL